MVTHPLCAVKPNRINDLTQARQCALLRSVSRPPLATLLTALPQDAELPQLPV